ncbi:hypothetical protein KSS87_021395 [Heliosperma pusillum]|nr:hypothetical protein KSS87_021395 [Heliosperma pusillum]
MSKIREKVKYILRARILKSALVQKIMLVICIFETIMSEILCNKLFLCSTYAHFVSIKLSTLLSGSSDATDVLGLCLLLVFFNILSEVTFGSFLVYIW